MLVMMDVLPGAVYLVVAVRQTEARPDPTSPETADDHLSHAEEQVQASFDGGGTWRVLGQQDIGSVSDLVLGIDGRNLYAATETGVWRLPLRPPNADQSDAAP